MKNWNLFSLMLFAIMNLGLVSCGDDDEVGDRNALVGTWQCTWIEGYEKYANNPEYDEEWNEAADFLAVFNEDGTAVIDGDECKWKLEGDQLFICDTGTNDEWDANTVLKLSDSEFIIETHEKDNDAEYYQKTTFKKISPR